MLIIMAAEQASWASRRWQRGAFSRKLGRVQRPLFDHHLATVCLHVAVSVKKWTSSSFADYDGCGAGWASMRKKLPKLQRCASCHRNLRQRFCENLVRVESLRISTQPEMSATEAQLGLGSEPEFEFNPAIEFALRFRIEFVRVQA